MFLILEIIQMQILELFNSFKFFSPNILHNFLSIFTKTKNIIKLVLYFQFFSKLFKINRTKNIINYLLLLFEINKFINTCF